MRQYSSLQEYNTWASYDSSAAALAEVINAYDYNYRITNILKVEIQLNEIVPIQGLLHDDGFKLTAAKFGFQTSYGKKLTLDQIINIANQGKPVIVSFLSSDAYPGGHSLVVIGGDNKSVRVVDSNTSNQHSFTRAQFMLYWNDFSAIVTPN